MSPLELSSGQGSSATHADLIGSGEINLLLTLEYVKSENILVFCGLSRNTDPYRGSKVYLKEENDWEKKKKKTPRKISAEQQHWAERKRDKAEGCRMVAPLNL